MEKEQQPMIPPKRFDLSGGCSDGLDAFRFFFKIIIGFSRRALRLAVIKNDHKRQETRDK